MGEGAEVGLMMKGEEEKIVESNEGRIEGEERNKIQGGMERDKEGVRKRKVRRREGGRKVEDDGGSSEEKLLISEVE